MVRHGRGRATGISVCESKVIAWAPNHRRSMICFVIHLLPCRQNKANETTKPMKPMRADDAEFNVGLSSGPDLDFDLEPTSESKSFTQPKINLETRYE